MDIERQFSKTVRSPFGPITILWGECSEGLRITRVVLSNEEAGVSSVDRAGAAVRRSCPTVDDFARLLIRFLGGEAVTLPLSAVDLDGCSNFQRRVLLVEYGIPRCRVGTYGWIAGRVGSSRGARAVGRALATNPFPIVIPCHRAICGDGGLGGFQGGRGMKRRLLEMEGVRFDERGKIGIEYLCEMPRRG